MSYAEAELLIKTTHFYSGCSCQLKRYSERRTQKDRRHFDIQSLGNNLYRRNQTFGRRITDLMTKFKLEKMLNEIQFLALS
ncbi:MAG: hypothetical protein RQ783_09015 [Gammaproteobacteria bacterium]|nr:hypothetical protein [Gammaproteobacteria bacterium]